MTTRLILILLLIRSTDRAMAQDGINYDEAKVPTYELMNVL